MKKNLNAGYWERDNRNPIIGSFIAVLAICAIYFIFQITVFYIYFMVELIATKGAYFKEHLNYIDSIRLFYSRYKFPLFTIVFFSEFIFFFFLTFLMFKKWHNLKIAEYFYLDKINAPAIILSCFGIFFLIPLSVFLSGIWFYVFPDLKKISEASNELMTIKNKVEFFFIVLAVGVTPAICEEILFRGYFQRTLERKIKAPWHFIISGTLFALIHQNNFGLPALIIIGIYLSFVFYRFKSLYASMSAHFCYNTALVLIMNINGLGILFEKFSENIFLTLAVSLMLLGIVLFFIFVYTERNFKKFI